MGRISTAKTQRTGNCDQIPRMAQWKPYLCGLWAAVYQIWPQRGLKAPFAAKFGMYFGSIGSVLGSSVPPNASYVSQNGLKSAQRESKWLKMAKNGPKWLKMAQNGPKWPKMAQNRLKIAPKWLKMAETLSIMG